MGTTIRPEISKKKSYYISRHRYFELVHFCRQFDDFIEEKDNVLETAIKSYDKESEIKSSDIADNTAKLATKISELDNKIELIINTCNETDTYLRDYILEAVTQGTPFSVLEAKGMPCSKNTFYDRYRRFFWLLDKYKCS